MISNKSIDALKAKCRHDNIALPLSKRPNITMLFVAGLLRFVVTAIAVCLLYMVFFNNHGVCKINRASIVVDCCYSICFSTTKINYDQ